MSIQPEWSHTPGASGGDHDSEFVDHCIECSEAAEDWVEWPCSRYRLVDAAIIAAKEPTPAACFNVWAEAPDDAPDAVMFTAFTRVLAGDPGPRVGGWDEWTGWVDLNDDPDRYEFEERPR